MGNRSNGSIEAAPCLVAQWLRTRECPGKSPSIQPCTLAFAKRFRGNGVLSDNGKCIYIDPPYNTGNEGWADNDNKAAGSNPARRSVSSSSSSFQSSATGFANSRSCRRGVLCSDCRTRKEVIRGGLKRLSVDLVETDQQAHPNAN